MARYVSRRIREEGEAFGSDSFLDVICNMVGIIVILVVVAGMRAQQAEAPDTAQPAKLAEIAAQAQSLQDDVLRLAHEIEKVQMKSAAYWLSRPSRASSGSPPRAARSTPHASKISICAARPTPSIKKWPRSNWRSPAT
jgi:hypothetical protein